MQVSGGHACGCGVPRVCHTAADDGGIGLGHVHNNHILATRTALPYTCWNTHGKFHETGMLICLCNFMHTMYTGNDGGCWRTGILHWASTWWPTLHCESVMIYRVKFVVCLYTSIIHDYASIRLVGLGFHF